MQDPIVNIDLGDGSGVRRLAFTEVQRAIGEFLNSAHFALAASVSMQLADQLPKALWPQLVAAESLYLHQQIAPASAYIDRALKINPRSIASLVVKSRLCLYSGDATKSERLIDSAIALAPGNSKLHQVKAELLVDTGKIERARDCYLNCVELDPANADGLLGLSLLPGDNLGAELIKNAESLSQVQEAPVENRIKAHFALANTYDKQGEVDRHFAHLNAGNDLKSNSLNFDAGAVAKETRRTIELFSSEFFAQRAKLHGNPAEIIFIVGFPRCGSTLVEQILSSHPLVSAAGEIFAMRHAIRDFAQATNVSRVDPSGLDHLQGDEIAAIADNYLQQVEQLNQSVHLTDKLLDNYKHIGVIHLAFPNAKIINVQRNPIDVCYSCYKHLFNLSAVPFTYNLENLASAYRAYRQLMRHWNEVLPGKIHTVEYEQLINSQEAVTQELLQHCGLAWNDACLNFHENARAVQTNSNIQVRQPLYVDSIERWKIYEDYLGPLLELSND